MTPSGGKTYPFIGAPADVVEMIDFISEPRPAPHNPDVISGSVSPLAVLTDSKRAMDVPASVAWSCREVKGYQR